MTIIFFERSPFMSVEFLDLFEDFKIVCYDDNYIYRLLSQNYELKTYSNQNLLNKIENDVAVEIMLEDDTFLKSVLDIKKDYFALFFFMNKNMDRLREKNKIPMALPDYSIQEDLGSKVNLKSICQSLNLPVNTSLVFEKSCIDIVVTYKKIASDLKIPFVLQGSNGVAGEDTFLISNENDFMSALNKVSNEFKVSRYISNNIPVSVHMCITDEEYCLKGPFLQIIGFPELSFSKFQYLGSDTNQSLFDNFFIKKVREMSIALAEYSKNKGYRGIMGIDYLWDKESGVVYPQELNTRFVAPTRLITGIQKEQNIIPDVLKHIGQFVQNVEALKKNDFKEGEIDLNEKNYSQLYIANNLTSDVTVVNYLEPGVYIIDQGKLIKTKSSLFLKDVEKDEILITYTAYLGSILVSGGIIAKIILKKSILNTGKYELNVESKSLIKIIKDNIIKK